jgi:CHAT domain-containing protein/tetratricopeptide (TPR) repeat protein
MLPEAARIAAANERDDLSIGTYKLCLGDVRRHWGAVDEAAILLAEAADRLGKVLPADDPDRSEALFLLAGCYLHQGKQGEAERLLRQVLQSYEAANWPEHPRIGDVLTHLAGIQEGRDEHDRALALYERALRNYVALQPTKAWPGDDRPLCRKIAATHDKLADAYLRRGEKAKAARSLAEAVRVIEKFQIKPYVFAECALRLRRLGEVRLALGRFEEAAEALEAAIEADTKSLGKAHPQLAADWLAMAKACRALDRDAEARKLEADAAALRHRLVEQHAAEPGRDLLWDARLDAANGRYDDALAKLARLHEVRRPVIDRYMAALPEQAQVDLARRAASGYHFSMSVATRCRNRAEAARRVLEVEMAYKSMAADAQSHQMASVYAASDPALRSMVTEITSLRRKIVAAEHGAGPAGPSTWPARTQPAPGRAIASVEFADVGAQNASPASCPTTGLVPMEQRLQRLEADLIRRSVPLARLRRLRDCNWESFEQALPEDTAFISYLSMFDTVYSKGLRTRQVYIVVVCRKGRPPVLCELELTIRQDGEEHAEGYVRGHGRDLGDLVIRPIWPHIKDCRRWIISPDSSLSRVPFGLLPVPGTTDYLIDSHEISYVISARDVLDFGRPASQEAGAVVLADPDFDSQVAPAPAIDRGRIDTRHLAGLRWNPLPGTRLEATRLRPLFADAGIPVVVKTGKDATKLALLSIRSPRYLHVATHGFFVHHPMMGARSNPFIKHVRYHKGKPIPVPNPLMYSGLALAGANRRDRVGEGVITAYEIKWINVWGTDLVTLSACDTGVGETTVGGGVRGLRQSLMQAGARRILTSLWKVPDNETSELMVAFYRRLLRGKPAAAALREAALEVRDARLGNHPAAHPFRWGGFVLIGDPGPVRAAGPSPKDPGRGPIRGEK